MTTMDTGPNLAAPPSAAVPTATPPPSAAPVTEPTGPPPPPADDSYIRVPKEQLQPWEGRFGEVISRAKTHDEYQDWFPTVQEFRDMGFKNAADFREYWQSLHPEASVQGTQPAPPDAPPAATNPDEKPLTVAAYKKMQADAKKTQDQDEQTRVDDVARADEAKFIDEVLSTAKAEKGSVRSKGMKSFLETALNEVVQERILGKLPSYATEADREKAMYDVATTTSTAEDREAAKVRFHDMWRDLTNETIAEFAAKDSNVPAASLGGGAGGPQNPKDYSKMGAAEFEESVPNEEFDEAVEESFARRMAQNK